MCCGPNLALRTHSSQTLAKVRCPIVRGEKSSRVGAAASYRCQPAALGRRQFAEGEHYRPEKPRFAGAGALLALAAEVGEADGGGPVQGGVGAGEPARGQQRGAPL